MIEEGHRLRYLEQALERIARAGSAAALSREMQRIAVDLGFDYYSLAVMAHDPRRQREPIFQSTFPQTYLDVYFGSDTHLHDPYFDVLARGVTPVPHTRMLPIFASRKVFKELYQAAMDLRIRHGISFPLPTVGVARGVGFWLVGTDSEFDERMRCHAPLLHVIASHFAAAAETLGLFPAEIDPNVRLSAREADCLRWLGLGRTTAEVADILEISERTVRFHVARACEKLGVERRMHAVSRALQLNLIQI